MKIFLLHIVIVHSFINLILSGKSELLNHKIINNILSRDRYENNGKFNLDIDFNTAELIKKHGYLIETHFVITEDNYILTLHRIPGKHNSHPVLLVHGLFACSALWVIIGPQNSLAYLLADNGYDVWLSNFRGNSYSRVHKSLSTEDAKFWDFSWHEMGKYDLPAIISYITNMKRSNLTYIGHSMGTTTFYVMSIMRPDISSRVQMMFSLGPIAYMKNIKTPLRLLAPFANDLKSILHILGKDDLFTNDNLIKYFAKYVCDADTLEHEICNNLMFIYFGYDKYHFNYTLPSFIFGHVISGSSVKTIVHYAQEIQSGKFQQYDYGREDNLKIYNSEEPSNYNISKITVPIALYYGNNDWLANVEDVLRLSSELNNIIDLYKVPNLQFGHMDFALAMDAPKLIYNRILRTIKGS